MTRWLILCCLGIIALLSPRAAVVYATDFERNPMTHGWDAGWLSHLVTNVRWIGRADGGHCLQVVNGIAQSPRFNVKAGQYYRLQFAAKGGGHPMWTVFFYNNTGEQLAYDHYSAVEPGDAWTTQTFYFTTKYPGISANVAFNTGGLGELQVDDVQIDTATAADADAWVKALETSLPAITPPAVTDAAMLLPHIRAKLAAGGPVRIVILGDSIGNDLSNAPLDILLRRSYPTAQVELRFTGRGSTGYVTFQRSVDWTVIRHKPDLLILLSITNRLDDELDTPVQKIIDDVRAALPETDILLVTPHVDAFSPHHYAGNAQREILRQVAAKNKLAMVDLLGAWQDYLQRSGKPQEWLQRDIVHMNERGRLVSAAAVAAWLMPEKTAGQ